MNEICWMIYGINEEAKIKKEMNEICRMIYGINEEAKLKKKWMKYAE